MTVAGKTHALPRLFLVMATQNPIEQEETYPLPEAQMDRFLIHVLVDYPKEESERDIMLLVRSEQVENGNTGASKSDERLSQELIFTARNEIHSIPSERMPATGRPRNVCASAEMACSLAL